jgi:outer membrane protein assembly factor BamB/tRNA A-37 threonylcarbamoyl transferase component Bud32
MLIKRMGINETGTVGERRDGATSDISAAGVGLGLGAATHVEGGAQGGQTSQLDAMRNQVSGVATLPRGSLLLQRYEIEQVLGIGGMSIVYRARDLRFEQVLRYCAVKEMFDANPDSTTSQRLNNFEREASILATLSHTSIPKIYDYFEQESRVYLVMEYIDGKDLESLLENRQQPMPEDEVLRWSIQICEVLSFLHRHQPQPIVFRDMKPSNVMIDNSNRVVLVDFGIAKVFQSDKKGTMIGTEGYSPPEQYRGVSEPRGDIYALGATMHHLLTGSDPRGETPFTFHERPPRRLNPRISPATEAIVMRALEYDINRRWPSADELRQALLGVLAQRSPTDAAALGAGVLPHSSAPLPPAAGATNVTAAAPALWTPSREAQAGTSAMDLSAATPVVGETTTLLWSFSSEDEIRSSPTVHKGVVYIGSYDSNLYALNAKSGDYLWKTATENGIASSPVGWENMVFVGSEDFGVYAFDSVRGRQAWVFRTGQPVRSSPRINNGLLYIGSDDQHIYCLEAKTGRLVWKYRCWMNVRSSATFAKGNIYIGSGDGHMYAIDGSNGSLRWKFRAGGPVMSTPAIAEGLVIFGAMDNTLYGIDMETSWAAWKFRTDHYITSSPAVAAGKVYFGSVDGHLYCVDVKSGRLIWKYKTGGQVTSSPKVFEGGVYFGSVDEYVYCLNAANGSLRWQFKTFGPVPSSPYVADGVCYIGSTDNKLYALAV